MGNEKLACLAVAQWLRAGRENARATAVPAERAAEARERNRRYHELRSKLRKIAPK